MALHIASLLVAEALIIYCFKSPDGLAYAYLTEQVEIQFQTQLASIVGHLF